MAVYTEEGHITRLSGADLSAKQYFIVKLNSSRQVILTAAATDQLLGVVANVPDAGTNAPVDVCVRNAEGTFKVQCGGTVAVGDRLTSDAAGKAITTVTAGNEVLGIAVEAGVAGQVIEYAHAGFAKV